MTGDANSGRPGLWTEAKYPGDSVRCLMVYRRDAVGRIELGDVRIQQYDSYLKVGMFVPGIQDPPRAGDTPHVWPEKHRDVTNAYDADAVYDNYVQEVYAAGWQNYHPEQHSMLRDKPRGDQ